MALNFPVPTQVGDTYTDPTTDHLYTCIVVGPPAVWIAGDGVAPDPESFVTVASNQTITGEKTFQPGLFVGGSTGAPNTTLSEDGSATFAGDITTTGDLITSDLVMSNMHRSDGNEVDGTSGHWCFQEGEGSLYVINRLTGERYAMNMTPIA